MEFKRFCLTSSLCQAIAKALRQGSSITSLALDQCSFPEGGILQICERGQEEYNIDDFSNHDMFSVFSTLYPPRTLRRIGCVSATNSTLQELSVEFGYRGRPSCHMSVCASSLLLALGRNKTLRKLRMSGFSSVDGSLISALHEGLGKNSTLETLEFRCAARVSTSFHVAAIEALQSNLNKTLKTLSISPCNPENMTDDEVNHLTSVVKKNYGLERLPFLASNVRIMRDLRCILRLNRAGRRYLLDGQGSDVSKGVDVLTFGGSWFPRISDDLNCVFLHLLENPSLCNRSHRRGSEEQVRASLKRFRGGFS